MKKIKQIGIKNLILPSLLFAFMLFVFAPFEIYLSNKGYFFFAGTEMLGLSLLAFVIGFVTCMMILILCAAINNKLFSVIYGMFIGGTLALYIQGNWDMTDYGAWNGGDIDWSDFIAQKWGFLALFVILIVLGAVFTAKRKEKAYKTVNIISGFIILILLYTITTLMITNGGLAKDKEYIATSENELELSAKQNMIVMIVDAYDSSAFEKMLNETDIKQSLDGFTYYPDTLGAYSSTDMSLPFIITGSDYKNDVLFGEHLDSAYADSPMINWLKDNGWETDIYSDILMPQANDGAGIANSRELMRVVNDRKQLMNYMYTMVLFRYMPQPIKNHFYFAADNIKGTLNSVKGEYEVYSEDNFVFYDKLDELSASDKENSGVFQLIHITGAHEPFTFTKDFVETDTTTSYEDECQGVLFVIDKFLEKMKETGLYDNTVIVIMADHGYYDDRQNPLLLVKGYNELHDMEVSDAAVSYYDLQKAFINLLKGDNIGNNVFDNVGDASRGRKFASVPWNTHLNFDTYSGTLEEVTFYGNARDLNSKAYEGVYYNEPESNLIK